MKNFGFVKPTITSDQYIFGASPVPFIIRRQDGNWTASRPQKEIQHTSFDTFNCTGFNTLAQIECYLKEVFGVTVNYSDRWLGIIAGTKPPGNDPHTVYEAIRKHGLIPEEMLPFDSSLQNVDEYYSFKGADEAKCREEGQKWLRQWEFKHDWVDKSAVKTALKTSPLARAVYAWAEDKGVYVRLSDDNHWTFQYAEDTYSKIEDSYEPTLKDVNQDVRYCKRIYIEKKPPVKQDWRTFNVIDALKALIRLIKPVQKAPEPTPTTLSEPSPRERLYAVAVVSLGMDASPKDVAPDELGCAETVNELYFKAFGEYIETPGISTTKLFAAMMDRPDKFVRQLTAEAGCIIISPTGMSSDPHTPIKNGHVGILGKDDVIMSNSSASGKFIENYTLLTWAERYKKRGSYPIYIFKPV